MLRPAALSSQKLCSHTFFAMVGVARREDWSLPRLARFVSRDARRVAREALSEQLSEADACCTSTLYVAGRSNENQSREADIPKAQLAPKRLRQRKWSDNIERHSNLQRQVQATSAPPPGRHKKIEFLNISSTNTHPKYLDSLHCDHKRKYSNRLGTHAPMDPPRKHASRLSAPRFTFICTIFLQHQSAFSQLMDTTLSSLAGLPHPIDRALDSAQLQLHPGVLEGQTSKHSGQEIVNGTHALSLFRGAHASKQTQSKPLFIRPTADSCTQALTADASTRIHVHDLHRQQHPSRPWPHGMGTPTKIKSLTPRTEPRRALGSGSAATRRARRARKSCTRTFSGFREKDTWLRKRGVACSSWLRPGPACTCSRCLEGLRQLRSGNMDKTAALLSARVGGDLRVPNPHDVPPPPLPGSHGRITNTASSRLGLRESDPSSAGKT